MDAGAGQAMDAQVTLVLAGDGVASLEALVGQLMSPMNDQRGQAEQLFNYCKQRHADALVLKMIQALQVIKRFVMKVSSVMILNMPPCSLVFTDCHHVLLLGATLLPIQVAR